MIISEGLLLEGGAINKEAFELSATFNSSDSLIKGIPLLYLSEEASYFDEIICGVSLLREAGMQFSAIRPIGDRDEFIWL